MSFTYTEYNYVGYDYPTNTFNKYQDKIKEHISELIRIEKNNNNRVYVNNMLIKIVMDILKEGYSPFIFFNEEYIINKLKLIRLNDIINKSIEWINRYKLCTCNVFNFCYYSIDPSYDRNMIYSIIKNNIIEYGIIPRCKYLLLSFQYYIQEKRVGTIQEVADYEILLNEIETDPEEFHNKYKHKLPTQNLSNLIEKTMNDELFEKEQPCCGICQYDIEPSQNYYELPCGHKYHVKDEECLELSTIVCWLKTNKLCPLCKKEVIL
uniref:RING-type domain-containing protein n=1 Tax=viral metagenome TaxID=1070528 RepID=A0A6C0I5C5_9ZZZZ